MLLYQKQDLNLGSYLIKPQTTSLSYKYFLSCLFSFCQKKFLGSHKPSALFNGYLCFVCSIAMIGVCTAVIGDVAAQLGCFIYLKDSVNAIAFVALGTSVPGITQLKPITDYEHESHWTGLYLFNCTKL